MIPLQLLNSKEEALERTISEPYAYQPKMSGLKKWVGILSLALAISQSSCSLFWPVWTVEVKNELPDKSTLFSIASPTRMILVRSGSANGDNRRWSFRQNIWETTRFWCLMRKRTAHVEIDVFWDDTTEDDSFFAKCNDEKCIWMARDDGIYLRNIPDQRDEFRHHWIPGAGHGFNK